MKLVGPGCEALEQKLSVLFPVRESRFQVMHKSVADWLLDCERKSSLYKINEEDVRTAHRRMVSSSLCVCALVLGTGGAAGGGITDTYRTHSLSDVGLTLANLCCGPRFSPSSGCSSPPNPSSLLSLFFFCCCGDELQKKRVLCSPSDVPPVLCGDVARAVRGCE